MRVGTVTSTMINFADFEPRRSTTPIYKQLALFVAAAIDAGELEPGDGLPGEVAIADAADVSVDTVRRALQVLRDDGQIQTAVGIGSFVTDK